MNGEQLYGFKRLLTTLRIGMHPRVRGLPLRQKPELIHASRKSEMTRLDGRIFTDTFTPYYASTAYDRDLDAVIRVGRGDPVPVITNVAATPCCTCS